MKKKFLVFGLMTIAIVSLYILKLASSSDSLFESNIEALMRDEAIITCSSTICGRCFEEKKAWPFYKCNWTGYQSDYCDCNKVGWF